MQVKKLYSQVNITFCWPYTSTMKSEFGQRLFDARKHAKLTQVELCQLVGMSQGTFGFLERQGQTSGYTPAIAKVCGVSVQWLAYGEGQMLGPELAAPPQVMIDPLVARRAFIVDDIEDLLGKFKTADQLRTAYALILNTLDTYRADLVSQEPPALLGATEHQTQSASYTKAEPLRTQKKTV